MRKLLAFFVVGLVITVVGLFVLKKQNDALWKDIQSPEYVNSANRLSLPELYDRYQRDMSLTPEVQTLAIVIARRGKPAAAFILDRVNSASSAQEVNNAVIVLAEMRRIKSYDICRNGPQYRVLLDAHERTKRGRHFPYYTEPRYICPER